MYTTTGQNWDVRFYRTRSVAPLDTFGLRRLCKCLGQACESHNAEIESSTGSELLRGFKLRSAWSWQSRAVSRCQRTDHHWQQVLIYRQFSTTSRVSWKQPEILPAITSHGFHRGRPQATGRSSAVIFAFAPRGFLAGVSFLVR
jgi:hypothetical protein